MLQVSLDLRDEADELRAFLETLGEADWSRPTPFLSWTPWDVVAHLHYFDLESMVSLEGEEAFAPHRKDLFAAIMAGRTNKELARERFAGLAVEQDLARPRPVEPAHELRDRRLAAARGADERHAVAGGQPQREVREQRLLEAVVAERHVAELDEAAMALCREIAANPPFAVKMFRRTLSRLGNPMVQRTMQEESMGMTAIYETRDYGEMKAARAEGREPNYEGR